MSDERECYVTLGQSLPELRDGALATRSAAQFDDGRVRDEQGRIRFHGAFTGGFSAGYYNTVGSKEGWAPSTFVSSRASRGGVKLQSVEDFMDDEDISDVGIAPRRVQTTSHFATAQKRELPEHVEGETSLLADAVAEIIKPVQFSAGMKLLSKQGWRPGHGVGTRAARRRAAEATTNIQRTYGCSLPPGKTEDSDSDDNIPANFQFSSRDLAPLRFTSKLDSFSLGYSGMKLSDARESMESVLFSDKGNRGIRGQAFGVGALEDDDDAEVYSAVDMDKYNFEDGGPSKDEEQLFGWTAPGQAPPPINKARILPAYRPITGFIMSDERVTEKAIHKAPMLPEKYRPFYRPVGAPAPTPVVRERTKLSAADRSVILGEVGSVKDLLKPSDKERLEKAVVPAVTKEPPVEPKQLKTINFASSSNADSFKPFTDDPEKQARFETFCTLVNSGGDYSSLSKRAGETSWERDQEKEEFVRAQQRFQPQLVMSSRFTRAQFADSELDVTMPAAEEVGPEATLRSAVKAKMFGQLTRRVQDWVPENTLCKRFNVKNPIVAPAAVKERISIFNVLPTKESEENERRPDETELEYVPHQKSSSRSSEDFGLSAMPVISAEPINIEERPAMDLFEAIFADSDEETTAAEAQDVIPPPQEKVVAPPLEVSSGIGDLLSDIFGPVTTVKPVARTSIPPEVIPISNKTQTEQKLSSDISSTVASQQVVDDNLLASGAPKFTFVPRDRQVTKLSTAAKKKDFNLFSVLVSSDSEPESSAIVSTKPEPLEFGPRLPDIVPSSDSDSRSPKAKVKKKKKHKKDKKKRRDKSQS